MALLLIRTFIFVALLLVLPDWYIYKRYISHAHDLRLKRSYWLPTFLLLAAFIIYGTMMDATTSSFGTFLIVLLCISVPKALFSVLDIVLRVVRRIFKMRSHVETPLAALAALFSFGYILYGAIWGREQFQVKEVTFSSPALPEAFDGYRIVQISDLHVGCWGGNVRAVERIVSLCNEQEADIILFTGDLVNILASELPAYMPALSQLHATDGVMSVLGNHDYGTYHRWPSPREMEANLDTLRSRQRQMGWDLLLNEHRILRRNDAAIAIVGVENSGKPPFPQKARLAQALRGTEGLFKVLMSHDPTHWRMEVLPESDVHLMLAGHTHDMQLSLFGHSPSALFYPEHNGLYLEGDRGLYVNIGLGVALLPMRIGAWPEITVITLKTK